jgi:hypothetical protein
MKRCLFLTAMCICGCVPQSAPVSTSGVHQAKTKVAVGSDGLTTEQRNVTARLAIDNKPGSIKHLYLISPLNGRQVFYQTVKGKISSSGKRLAPKTVNWRQNKVPITDTGIAVDIGGELAVTNEVIQDDGTYGDSSEYLFFWNQSGQYFQLYVGGLCVVVSDQPTSFQDVVIRNERE